MTFWQDPQFGDRMIILMAALVLVLQITMVAQRWLVTNIHAFAVQSLLLAGIANTVAYFTGARHIYIAAGLTLMLKAILLPVILRRLVTRIGIRQEIEPLVNVPVSVLISGLLTLLAYVVAEPLQAHPAIGAASLGHNTLPVAIALFLSKLALLASAVALVETGNAKMRLFRVPELLAVAFVLSALSLVSTFLFGGRG